MFKPVAIAVDALCGCSGWDEKTSGSFRTRFLENCMFHMGKNLLFQKPVVSKFGLFYRFRLICQKFGIFSETTGFETTGFSPCICLYLPRVFAVLGISGKRNETSGDDLGECAAWPRRASRAFTAPNQWLTRKQMKNTSG